MFDDLGMIGCLATIASAFIFIVEECGFFLLRFASYKIKCVREVGREFLRQKCVQRVDDFERSHLSLYPTYPVSVCDELYHRLHYCLLMYL